MKKLILFFVIILGLSTTAQNKIEWHDGVVLTLKDFASNNSKIGNVSYASLHMQNGLRYGVEMNSLQFMLTKNFNTMVLVEFDPNASSIIAPSDDIALSLVNFANYQFNLSELYARKLRKALYDHKQFGSAISYIQSIYDEVQKAYTERLNNASNLTNMGIEGDDIIRLNKEVLEEIASMPDFCKTCKIDKKQRL